jgi:hypothetical protein
MATTYDVGDYVRCSAAFTQAAVAVDPTTVLLKVLAPDGTSTTYTYALATITKDSAGNYHVDVPVTMEGRYQYRWTSTGTGAASEEGFLYVRERAVS